ncbi:MAG: ribulose-phosphate 3-epimerase [Candidatus Riflebacteria bacterium RBG_13_59_9]|nr:MAG: ribulose-phosphate 3-epimerase [Candidatus Riflebacteria bacterium RBG_13_59_9]
MRLAPSILAADFTNLAQAIKLVESARCEYVHFDVMDGHFVPNLTFGPPLLALARELTDIPFDVHLMVTDPEAYIERLGEIGVEVISFHIEAERFAPRLVKQIQSHNALASVALNPQTPLTAIEDILALLDNVLIMTVDPGYHGQEFIQTMFRKIEKLHSYREDRELMFTIEVDGGVCEDNLETLRQLGVDMVVAGKAFFQAKDPVLFAARVHGSRRRFHA